jgi:DNA-binding MarR family transcriptional regulator
LDEIAVHGENDSLVENVTDLALEYEFVTPYTSLLVEITEPAKDEIPDGQDSDNDGYPDDWELKYGSDPNDPNDPAVSVNGNSTTNIIPPSPNTPIDTDGDGVADDWDTHPYDPNRWGKDASIPGMDTMDDDDDEKSSDADNSLICLAFPALIILIGVLLPVFLYSKIKRHKLLEHQRREMIYNYVQEHPGEHFRGIQKALNLEVGVIAHHINKLEREEFIKSRQDGQYRRFYPMDAKIDVKLILSNLQERILNRVKTSPGITGATLAEHLGVSKKVVQYHVRVLQNAGFLVVEKQGRDSVCYASIGD